MHTAAYYDKLNEWYNYLFEGSLESDFQQYGQMEKQRWEQSEKRREEKKEERRSEKRKSQGARKGRKVAKHCVFPMICGSRGSKSRLAKAAGTEPSGQMRDKKLHTVVARSTCRSQNAQNTSVSDRFWKLTCRKSARRCGAKHISRSKCEKHYMFGPLLGSDVVSRGRTRDMFIRDVRRSGRWFPERGCILEHLRSSGLGRCFCVTGAALRMTWHHFFVACATL